MQSINVVLAHRDSALLQSLTPSSHKEFLSFVTVNTASDAGEAIARLRARLAIVDLEVVSFFELDGLCREFPATAFVTTHRLADDDMWSQSLAAGAVDCCVAADLPRILEATERYIPIEELRAASAA